MAGPLIWNGLNAKALTRDILLSNTFYNSIRVGNQFSHNSSTGVESGGILSINSPPSALFDLSAGSGTFIDYTVPTVPTFKSISWNTFTAQTVTGLATQDETYILINNAGAIIQQSNYPTPAQRRTNIFIGRIGHTSRVTIQFATSFPDFSQSISSSVFDVFDALGPFNISGNETLNNGANLTFQRTAGRMFFRSFNYPTDNYNPHTITTAAVTPAAFNYRQRTGGIIGGPGTVTSVDPANYDSGAGSPTAIPGGPNVSTIQRIYLAPNGVMQIQYGQTLYPNITTAAASIGTDTFIQNPALTNVTILVGYLVVRSGATALNNTGDGIFLRAPKFETGVGGGVNTVTSLQQTYNSSVPAVINLDTTSGRIRFYDNAVPIGSLFQVGNSGGGINYLNVDATGIQVTGTIDTSLTASRAVVSGPSKQLQSSATTTAQIGFLSNVNSDIQAQINTNKAGQSNLIIDPSFESGTVSQWSLGTTGTLTNGIPTGTPTFGSGASGNLSISAQTTGALLGTYSLQYQHVTNTTVAGNMMATNAITIQPEFQGKVMGVKFAYQTTANPTNGNYSGTSANSFGWALYDVTNSAWIGTAGQFNIVQNSGVGICTGTAQLPINTTSVRLVFYNVTATTNNINGGAITLLLDDWYFGPQVTAQAPAMSDWIAYTPAFNGFGTPSAINFYYKRVGDSIVVRGAFTPGTVTAVEARIGFPAGMTSASTIPTLQAAGQWVTGGLSATTIIPQLLVEPSVAYFTVGLYQGTTNALAKQLGNAGIVNGATSIDSFQVPISGFSSNTVSSADTDTRVVACSVLKSSGQSITTGVATVVTWDVVSFDTHGAWNTSTSTYTIPVSGIYSIDGSLLENGSVAAGAGNVSLLKNGSLFLDTRDASRQGVTSGIGLPFTFQAQFNAGDTVRLQVNLSYATPNIGGNNTSNGISSLSFRRLSGPAVVQASESVNLFRTCDATGQALNNGILSYINYQQAIIDSNNSWRPAAGAYNAATGTFATTQPGYVCPVSGKYLISAQVGVTYAATVNYFTFINIYKNLSGTNLTTLQNTVTGNATGTNCIQYTGMLNCNAGDVISVLVNQTSGANRAVDSSASDRTSLTITRVGN